MDINTNKIQGLDKYLNPKLTHNPLFGYVLQEEIDKALELGMIKKTEYKGNTEWRVLNIETYKERTKIFLDLKRQMVVQTLNLDKTPEDNLLSQIPF